LQQENSRLALTSQTVSPFFRKMTKTLLDQVMPYAKLVLTSVFTLKLAKEANYLTYLCPEMS
jgi:hypothetical protein